jgi:TRAP-type mannitol/chloroaromatic compound transport system permease small subunit
MTTINENPDGTPRICVALDAFIQSVGHMISWLNVVLIVVILVQVILRYGFGKGMVAIEELQWHLYAILILIGLSYGLVMDVHIRMDVFRRNFSRKTQEWVELLGILFLLLPMIIVLFFHGIDFVETSWHVGERSDSPLGLPYRWAIKSMIPLSMFLLVIAALSRMIRALAVIFGRSSGRQAGGSL